MLDFIAKYWLEVIFGLIVTGMGIAMRRLQKMYKDSQTSKRNEEKQELLAEVDLKISQQNERMEKADAELTEKICRIEKNMDVIVEGMLSVQGQSFRSTCRRLLEPAHIITMDEFEQVANDHTTYNKLGGNHVGDQLFKQVEIKFSNQTQK